MSNAPRSSASAPKTVALYGSTYPVKDKLAKLGGRPRKDSGGKWYWEIPAAKEAEARALVDGGRSGGGGGLAFTDFKPTAEQALLRDFILSSSRNLFIRAGAGCGKTTVALWLLSLIAEGSKVMVAFNSDIKTDIQEKAPKGVDVLTMNALGYRALCRAFDMKIKVDSNNLFEIFKARFGESILKDRYGFFAQVKKLIGFAKGALVEDAASLEQIAQSFDLQFEDPAGDDATTEAVTLALDIMYEQRMVGVPAAIDFDDQMWLPVVLNLPFPQYGTLVIDEAQDTNPLNLEMLSRCVAPGGRVVAVGDQNQCVAVDTLVTMADGTKRMAGVLRAGDRVLAYRNGKTVSQTVKHVLPSQWRRGIRIKTKGGKTLTMSPDHQIWATTPDMRGMGRTLVYLMWRSDMGFRVGVTNKCEADENPYGSRARMEKAERLWILKVCDAREEALFWEEFYSLKYSIPTAVFEAAGRDVIAENVKRLFEEFGGNGKTLLKALDLSFDHPNWCVVSMPREGQERARRTVNLIAHAKKGSQVSLEWTGADLDEVLHANGVSFTHEPENRRRLRKFHNSYRDALTYGKALARITSANFRERLSTENGPVYLLTASAIIPTMKVPVESKGGIVFDEIVSVEHVKDKTFVDLDVDDASNFFGGRILSHNCIYSWRGADQFAIEKITERFDMETLNLMTTFRCGKAIVAEAQTFVPDFRAGPNNHEGAVRTIRAGAFFAQVEAGDMVLSRTNAPLAAACLRLLRAGKPAAIVGRNGDLVSALIKLVRKAKADSVASLESYLGEWLRKETEKIMRRLPINETALDAANDKIDTILAFSADAEDVAEVIERIEKVFDDRDSGPGARRIDLSTVHKAKGRERDTVFMFDDTFLQSRKNRDGEWVAPSQEEKNLAYVAITRAKRELVHVDGMKKLAKR